MFKFDDLPSINELLAKVAAGDERAQQILYDYLKPQVHYAVKYELRKKGCGNPEEDSPEIGNSCLGKLLQSIGKLRNPGSLGSYLNSIIENDVSAHIPRCIKKQCEVPFESLQNVPAEIARPDDVIINAEFWDMALALAKTIHPKLPEILRLRFRRDLRLMEIAELVDESYDNVRTIYSRGLGKLNELLKDEVTMAQFRI